MIYSVILDLPHNQYIGQLDFDDEPHVGEIVEVVPGALFIIEECLPFNSKIKMRFKIVWHKFDILGSLQNLGFKRYWFW